MDENLQFLISLKERHGPLAGGEAAVKFAKVRPVQTGGGPRVGRRGAGWDEEHHYQVRRSAERGGAAARGSSRWEEYMCILDTVRFIRDSLICLRSFIFFARFFQSWMICISSFPCKPWRKLFNAICVHRRKQLFALWIVPYILPSAQCVQLTLITSFHCLWRALNEDRLSGRKLSE